MQILANAEIRALRQEVFSLITIAAKLIKFVTDNKDVPDQTGDYIAELDKAIKLIGGATATTNSKPFNFSGPETNSGGIRSHVF